MKPPVEGRAGLQREVLGSLALVMGLATLVLVGLIVVHHERTLRATLGPALLAEARAGAFGDPALPGTLWWELAEDGRFEAWHPGTRAPDGETRELAEQARTRGAALLRLGGLAEGIRFAAPVAARRSVAVALLPEESSRALRARPLAIVGLLGAADLAVFSIFAALVLRRRVVRPLEELAAAARAVGAGEAARAPVGGPRETAEVARAWNEMTEALELRSEDLAKAVSELRAANAELRRTRAGLDRAERLALVGRLAAGVAHEVGNPIGAMLAFVELASRDPGLGEKSREHLARAGREGERVRVILRQLLDFSRPSRPAPVPLDLAQSAEEAVRLVAAQRANRGIAFEVRRLPGAGLALGDPSAVLQILLNLVLNAADAVAGAESPAIVLEVRRTALRAREGDGDGAAAFARMQPDAAECRVIDNGCGVAESDRERIFDPFFSTKPPGQGTGLGLSTAARQAEEMEGALLLVDAPPGFATSVALRLPAAPERMPADAVRRGDAGMQAASQSAPGCRAATGTEGSAKGSR